MLKKSDLYSSLTQTNQQIWQEDWEHTLRHIEFDNINIDNLNTFLKPFVLERYLPKDKGEKKRILSNLFYIIQKIVFTPYSRYKKYLNQPEFLLLLTNLFNLNKIYKDIDKEGFLVFGVDGYNDQAEIFAKHFGYEAFSYFAQNIDFSPSLVFQIARGLDIKANINQSGRSVLVDILKEKYNNRVPFFDIFSDEEKTRDVLTSFKLIKELEQIYEEDPELKDKDVFYNVTRTQSFPECFLKVVTSVCSIMEPQEYADFLIEHIIENNKGYKPFSEPHYVREYIPPYYSSVFPSKISIAVLEKLKDLNFIELFLSLTKENDFKKILYKIRDKNFIENYETLEKNFSDHENFNQMRFFLLLFNVIKASLRLSYSQENALKIKILFGGDFEWLDKSDTIFQNGFASDEELFDYFVEHPEKASSCVVDFPGKKEIIKEFREKQETQVLNMKNIYQYARDKNIYTFIDGFGGSSSLIKNILIDEAPKIGISSDEMEKYIKHIRIYSVDKSEWIKLCHENNLPQNFLGVDLNKIRGIWLPKFLDHEGKIRPVIISVRGYENEGIKQLFKNLNIYIRPEELIIAHEGGHALHYLADPGGTYTDIDYEDSAMGDYLGSVQENIAYSHGQLPFFFELIKKNIWRVLEKPIIKKAIYAWIVNNVLSSDDASLQGLYKNREMMKKALELQKEFNIDIAEYIEKKQKRQSFKIIDALISLQKENKRKILIDLMQRKNKIIKAIHENQEQLLFYKNLKRKHETNIYNDKISLLEREQKRLYGELNIINERRKMVLFDKFNIDMEDAAQAIVEGYIREYFIDYSEFLKLNQNKEDISREDIEDHTNFIMDATFGGTGEYRPLTSEILPYSTTSIDRSEGFFPHLEEKEASFIKNMIKVSNKLDNSGLYKISDKLEKLIRGTYVV